MGFLGVPLPNTLKDPASFIQELQIKGIVLTGGNDLSVVPNGQNKAPQRDALETKIIQTCSQLKIPLLVVCRGMQLLVHVNKGEIIPVDDHVRNPHAITILKNDLWNCPSEKVNSFHQFGVSPKNLSENFIILATAPGGSIEAVKHQKYPQWGIMWHPERFPASKLDAPLFQRVFQK
jgi:putative glutamine amidotransferase